MNPTNPRKYNNFSRQGNFEIHCQVLRYLDIKVNLTAGFIAIFCNNLIN